MPAAMASDTGMRPPPIACWTAATVGWASAAVASAASRTLGESLMSRSRKTHGGLAVSAAVLPVQRERPIAAGWRRSRAHKTDFRLTPLRADAASVGGNVPQVAFERADPVRGGEAVRLRSALRC